MEEAGELYQLQQTVKKLSEEVAQNEKRIQQLELRIQQLHQNAVVVPKEKNANASIYKRATLENFIGLQLIHLVGIVVLVIGLSIGVKYAIDRDLISAFARIALTYMAGGLLFFFSWRLKKKYAFFSAILFSGAMASLYFTTYAAYVYFGLFSFAAAFIIMILLTFFTAYEALIYNREEIAILGLVGAYAIPFLISSNSGRADLFFSYIFLINAVIVFLSFKKEWKLVGQLAQLITWILLIGWCTKKITAGQEWAGVLFMVLFFILFQVNGLSGAFKKRILNNKELQQLVLNVIALYGTAISIFTSFLKIPFAIVTFSVTAFMAIQAFLFYTLLPRQLVVTHVYTALSVMLAVIFIGAEWHGILVTLLWLTTAVILFTAGVFLKSNGLRMGAILLIGITLLKLVVVDSLRFSAVQKIIAYITLGALLLIVSFFYQKFKERLFDKEE